LLVFSNDHYAGTSFPPTEVHAFRFATIEKIGYVTSSPMFVA